MYSILVDRNEARAQAEYTAAVMAKVQGADIEIPTFDERRTEWEDWLRSVPPEFDPGMDENSRTLMQALFPRRPEG